MNPQDSTPRRRKPPRNYGSGGLRKRVERRTRADGAVVDLVRWEGRLRLPNGQRRSFYGRTQRAVLDQIEAARRDQEKGVRLDLARTTVGDWLRYWIETVVKRSKRPNTYRSYEQSVRVHIAPITDARCGTYGGLGRIRLGALRSHHVSAWVADREAAGLAPTTVNRLWAVLHAALDHAVRQDLLARNPASRVPLPRIEKTEPRAMPRDQARQLLRTVASEADAALYALELATGIRQGELLGLRWADDERAPGVDLARGELRILEPIQRGERSPLKRGSSRRVLRLRPRLVELLRHQRDLVDALELAAAQRWREHNLVFPSRVGTPRRAANRWRSWKRLLKRARLDQSWKFHELRHTAASVPLAEGASLFHVSRMLGHASIAITADVYGAWTDEGREDVAERLERALVAGSGVTLGVTDPARALPEEIAEIALAPRGAPGGE